MLCLKCMSQGSPIPEHLHVSPEQRDPLPLLPVLLVGQHPLVPRGVSGTLLGNGRQEGWHAAPTAVAASLRPVDGCPARCCPEEEGHNLLRVRQ